MEVLLTSVSCFEVALKFILSSRMCHFIANKIYELLHFVLNSNLLTLRKFLHFGLGSTPTTASLNSTQTKHF